MTKYLCTSCETTFTHDAGKLRCPQCLRQHGLVEGTRPPEKKTASAPKRWALILGLLGLSALGLAGGGALLYHRSHTDLPNPGQLYILDADMLKKTLLKRGVPKDRLVDPFAAGEAVKALASSVQEPDAQKRARLLARKVAAKISRFSADFKGLGQGLLRSPDQLLAGKAGKGARALSFELAALMVSVLRAAGLEAVLAQVHQVDAPMITADPEGAAGRYVAVVYRGGELGRKALLALDPLRALALPSWAGKGDDAEMSCSASSPMEPLDDGSAAARLLSLRALRTPRDASQEAYALSSLAIKASAPSATLHVARALVLAASGGKRDALAEARKALSLRKDPPRYTALAIMSLAGGKPEGALLNLREALKLDAKFWPAHQLLAMVLAKPEEASKHMKAALAVAPREPSVMLTLAARLMRTGKLQPAIKVLRAVVTIRRGRQARLMLYQALVLTGQRAEADRVKARLLAAATATERADLEKLFKAMTPPPAAAGSSPDRTEPSSGSTDPGGPPAAPRIPRLKLPDVTLGK